MPQRIQLRRTKGWRKPEGAIVVARPTRWGNPFRMVAPEIVADDGGGSWWAPEGARQVAVDLYRQLILTGEAGTIRALTDARVRPSLQEIRKVLAGRDLACWCPLDQPCHADVLLELANHP